MRCDKCGTDSNSKFCPNCGNPLPLQSASISHSTSSPPQTAPIQSDSEQEPVFSKNKKIAALEKQLWEKKNQLAQAKSRARAYYDYATTQAELLDDYLKPQFQEILEKNNKFLQEKTLPYLGNWNDPAWQKWSPVRTNQSDQSYELVINETPLLRTGKATHASKLDGQRLTVPIFCSFIGKEKTIIISTEKNHEMGSALMQSLLFRSYLMLPHRVRYVLLDPSGNGLAFPMRRYLTDVREYTGDIRRDLEEVRKEMARINLTYLDAKVTSFDQIPSDIRLSEKYQFVFAADFPKGYSRSDIETLQNISSIGPKMGTYVFIHHNPAYELPGRDMSMDNFENAEWLNADSKEITFDTITLQFEVDRPPEPSLQEQLSERIKAEKPEEPVVSWENIVNIPCENWWKEDASKIIETPIGSRGGNNALNIWFGVNAENRPCVHGMLGAQSGQGKSTLFHVLISGLTMRYSPEELRLYLIDGKDGVEFEPYRKHQLPHAEVISLRSSPELSRSVLGELVSEKERRNAIFAEIGVKDYVGYREKGSPKGILPRILLLVDEYQELFEGDRDGVASNYLLQLSQQGRSAGIHMLIASQRFMAQGMLNAAGIFANFHLRMALRMAKPEIDSLTEFGKRGKEMIMSCDAPGKIVINDQGGLDGENANVFGKVALIQVEDQEEKSELSVMLESLKTKAQQLDEKSLPFQIVLDGKWQPNLSDNPFILKLLRDSEWMSSSDFEQYARNPIKSGGNSGGLGIENWYGSEHPVITWIGQQFSIRGQATVIFRRSASENALVIGNAHAPRYGMLASILTSVCVNLPPQHAKFVIFDRSPAGSLYADVLKLVCNEVLTPGGFDIQFSKEVKDIEDILNQLYDEMERRKTLSEDDVQNEPSIFAVLTELDGVQGLRRKTDTYNDMGASPLTDKLKKLYEESSIYGIHLIISFSAVRPATSVIEERRGLPHFRHRIALQMSEEESYTYVRNRKAAQLQQDGPTPICALYVDINSDQQIRFKPYTSDVPIGSNADSFSQQLETIGHALEKRR